MYFIGDSHSISSFKEAIKRSQVKKQNLIHVGDFGLGHQPLWKDLHDLEKLNEFLEETSNKLYVIRGNHDNPIFWKRRYGLNLPKYSSIDLIDDYTFRKIEDKSILFMGGAISIDRLVRSAEYPPTWWIDEKFEYNLSILQTTLDKMKKVDIVVTHTAPEFVIPYLKNGFPDMVKQWVDMETSHWGTNLEKELNTERKQLTNIYNHIIDNHKIPDHWFYGHFHRHSEEIHNNTKFIGLGINELYELK
jgi:DNA repair exonuclease SbcCD nuclease subunit